MDKKLYKLMNWPRIEGIVYSEEDHPEDILGIHYYGKNMLIQTYQPHAKAVFFLDEDDNVEHRMELVDEEGFFALLLPKKKVNSYKFCIEDSSHNETEIIDPYQFKPTIKKDDIDKYSIGIHYEMYKVLGAHLQTINGIEGTSFAVYAPNAVRVSVVGDFNKWDGRVNQMMRVNQSGIFWLFIPGVKEGDLYQYEIKFKNDMISLKADPYELSHELRPGSKSVVTKETDFTWTDFKFLRDKKNEDFYKSPVNILKIHPATFFESKPNEFINYKDMAKPLIDYVKEMHYTHVELMGIMEHPLDESLGYQVIGYYAPTSRYGSVDDLKYLINELHKNNVTVLMDWVPARFPRDAYGLSYFDGTKLYDYEDNRKGERNDIGTNVFDYGKNEVVNYLIGSALYWLRDLHFDGLRIDDVDSIIYYDNGNSDYPATNIYGSNENLEGIEFIKKLNNAVHKKCPGAVMIAEEKRAYPLVTEKVEKDGLGFDFKWNYGYTHDLINYLKYDPYFRKHHHSELSFSMIYNYCEKFIVTLQHNIDNLEGKSIYENMPGVKADKYANLRAAFAYTMMHPGKKLFFYENTLPIINEWNVKQKNINITEEQITFATFMKDINALYLKHPALYELDYLTEGFTWVDAVNAENNLLVFTRQDKNEKLLVVAHFENVSRNDFEIPVPYDAKYKEIFNTDNEAYGGSGFVNPRVKNTLLDKNKSGRLYIKAKLAPLSIMVFVINDIVVKGKDKVSSQKKERILKNKELLKDKLAKEYNQAQEELQNGGN